MNVFKFQNLTTPNIAAYKAVKLLSFSFASKTLTNTGGRGEGILNWNTCVKIINSVSYAMYFQNSLKFYYNNIIHHNVTWKKLMKKGYPLQNNTVLYLYFQLFMTGSKWLNVRTWY